MEDIPKVVLTIVVCLILMAVGIFAVLVFVTTVGMESDVMEQFTVENPAVDKVVTLKSKPSAKPTITQYNGIGWVAVAAADIEWNGLYTLTVEHEGMQG